MKPKAGVESEESPTFREGTLPLDARLYLPNNGEKPVLVPNYDLGAFLELLRHRTGVEEYPKFSFEQVAIEGKVAGNIIELAGTFRLLLVDKPAEALSIPLRFAACQLTSAPKFDGNGTSLLTLSPDGLGYRWWLKADAAGEFGAKLSGQSLVSLSGDQKSVKLSLPLAPCLIAFRLPADAVDIEVSGQGNEVYESKSDDAGQNISIRGSGGEMAVSWRSKDSLRRVSAVEVRSRTRIEIEDPKSTWEGNSTVSVSWSGEDMPDELTLRLPPGSRFLPSPYSSDLYSIADNGSAGEPPQDRPVDLLIRFRTSELPLTNSLDIPIQFQWQPPSVDRNAPVKPFALPGVSLKNVEPHEGTLEYVMPSTYSLQWRAGEGAEFVQQTRVHDELERSQYVFRFYRQPFELNGNLRRESSLAEVRPSYLAEVDRNKIKLTGWLECSFDVAQRPALGVALGDWVLESADSIPSLAEPRATGSALGQETRNDGLILLSQSEPPTGAGGGRRTQQVWRLVAYRKWTADDSKMLNLQIPKIARALDDGSAADVDHGSGVLLVCGADNLQLRWNESSSSGLLLDSLSMQLGKLLFEEQLDRTTVYRFQAGAEAVPSWSGSAEFLPRQISYQQQARCAVDARSVAVSQKFELRIAYEPLESLRFLLSPSSSNAFVKVNDEIATLRVLTREQNDASVPDSWRRHELVGADNLRGKVTVTIESKVSLPPMGASREPYRVAIPIARLELPEGARPISQQAVVSRNRDMEVFPDQSDDSSDPAASRLTSLDEQTLELAPEQHEILLRIRQLDRVNDPAVRVSKAWLQTALTGTRRRDRYCAKIQTSQSKITMQLPTTLGPPTVFVDGQNISTNNIAADRFQFELPKKADGSEYVLDVWTWPEGGLTWISPINVQVPLIEGTSMVDRFYWQLVSPPSHHLALIPSQFTSEWQWVWNGFWWSRRSRLSQAELERWVGVAQQAQLPSGTNRYLLSSFGEAAGFQAWIVSRMALWLPVGLAAILATVILGSVRLLRRSSLLMVVAVLLGCGAMVWPDTAALLGQVVLLSLGLVALMLVVRATIDMRVRRRSVFTSRSSLGLDRSDHFSVTRQVQAAPSMSQINTIVPADSGVKQP